MKSSAIREFRDHAPLQPFEIHLADGRSLTLATPDHIMMISPTNQEFVLYQSDGTLDFVDASPITSVTRKARRKAAQARLVNSRGRFTGPILPGTGQVQETRSWSDWLAALRGS